MGMVGGAGASSTHSFPGILLAVAPGICDIQGAFQLASVVFTVNLQCGGAGAPLPEACSGWVK